MRAPVSSATTMPGCPPSGNAPCNLGTGWQIRDATRAIGVWLLLVTWAGAGELAVAVSRSGPALGQNASPLADFRTRVNAYDALQRKVQATVPKLSTEATPEEIDRYQRSLLAGIAGARGNAKQGDIFTQPVRRVIRGLIVQTFARGDRATLRESILEDNPGRVRLTVNGPYPDEVPLSNMPADLLMILPPLPMVLEYRFVGDNLILLDSAARLIVDVMPQALPK